MPNDAENSVREILAYLGEDVARDGLLDTPKRVVKSWGELFSGYNKQPEDIFTTFEKGSYDNLVSLVGIEFTSTCEHHMQPFLGYAHIAYLPGDKVVGISKLARLLEIYSRRLQIQERICEQVTKAIMVHLGAKAAACIIEAKHLCMVSRGVCKQHSTMITSSMKGEFLVSAHLKAEFLQLVQLTKTGG